MRERRTISRREALALLVALPLAACTSNDSTPSDSTSAAGSDLPDALEATVRLGERRNELVPDEADVEFLADALGIDPNTGVDATLLANLTQQVRDDYAAEATENLDGWLLSTTETRAAALVALSV